MTPSAMETRAIQRILLALDSSVPNPVALEEAARLARRLGAELNVLFIEDSGLIDLAQSPFARHYNLLSRRMETVDMGEMESRLQAQAHERRRAVETVARRAGLRWSFRTMRGRAAEVMIASAADQDLLLIGWATSQTDRDYLGRARLRGPRRQQASTIRAIAVGSQRPVLLLREGDILNRPIAVVFDGKPGAQRALLTAAMLAGVARDKLVVMLAGDTDLAELAEAIHKDTPLREIEYVVLNDASLDAVRAARARGLRHGRARRGVFTADQRGW